jgi:Zn-dependent protease with chaperone function
MFCAMQYALYSREEELRCDRYAALQGGLKVTRGGISFFKKQAEKENYLKRKICSPFSSHPLYEKRIEELRRIYTMQLIKKKIGASAFHESFNILKKYLPKK